MSAATSLLASLPAVQQLQAGCAHLGLPTHTAVELVRFLTLKRLISLRPDSSRVLGVSPGYQLDRLWHWMLLNTEVARGIHTLVGGEVDHATPDAAPLGDDTKMLRRLLALNLMAREGWAPDAQLWKEPGTKLAAIDQMPCPLSKAPLYFSRIMTKQQFRQLVVDLKAISCSSVAAGAAAQAANHHPAVAAPAAGTAAAGAAAAGAAAAAVLEGVAAAPAPRAAPRAAPAASVASCAASGPEDPAGADRGARKRARSDGGGVMGSAGRQRQHEEAAHSAEVQPALLHLMITDNVGQAVDFPYVEPTKPLKHIMDDYAAIRRLNPSTLWYTLNDKPLRPDQTPAELGLEDHDWIAAYWLNGEAVDHGGFGEY